MDEWTASRPGPEPVWTLCRRERSLAPAAYQTRGYASANLVYCNLLGLMCYPETLSADRCLLNMQLSWMKFIVQFKRALVMSVNLFSYFSFYDAAGICTSERQDCAPSSQAANSHSLCLQQPFSWLKSQSFVFRWKSFPSFETKFIVSSHAYTEYFYTGFVGLCYANLTLRLRFLRNKDHSKSTDRKLTWFFGLAVGSAHVSV
jgi:hypothetical protein